MTAPATPHIPVTSSVVELKPCPFCGGSKVGTIHIRDGRRATCACGAAAKPCFHGPSDQPTADERAITAWNTRTTPEAADIITAYETALDWFGSNTRLELSHYSPTYGDDADQSEEWRVHEQRGSINDREWELLGRGPTPLEAIQNARESRP